MLRCFQFVKELDFGFKIIDEPYMNVPHGPAFPLEGKGDREAVDEGNRASDKPEIGLYEK